MGLGKTIKDLRLAWGWTLEELEERSGVAVGTISALENRDSSRSQYFSQLADALRIGMPILMAASKKGELPISWTDGEDILFIETVDGRPRVCVKPRAHDARQLTAQEPRAAFGMEPILAWEHLEDLPEGEFVMVPRLDVHLSAGAGREQVEIELVKDNPQAFRAEWIRLMRLKPNKLAAMRASGESMEPTIHDGDSLLVDTSQTSVSDGKVYALWYDGGERVKRLFRLPGGGLRIVSDNTKHPPIEVGPDHPEHVRIIGRVVHRSGTGGL
jgi:phage repressor protein C with HTH and peptisase S24 domain